jgi:hypothetical protein
MMNCPKYGTTECAGGVCYVCGTLGDDPVNCAPEDDVIQVDVILGYVGLDGLFVRRPTTLTTMTVRKPKRDLRLKAA